MTVKSDDVLNRLLASSMLVVCPKCGSSATYVGSPKEVNEAAEQFYQLHEGCYRRAKESK